MTYCGMSPPGPSVQLVTGSRCVPGTDWCLLMRPSGVPIKPGVNSIIAEQSAATKNGVHLECRVHPFMMRSVAFLISFIIAIVSSADPLPKPCPLRPCVECEPGFETVVIKDANGCDECHCKPTCDLVECKSGEQCILRDVQCFAAPCFPQPTCVSCPVFNVLCAPGYKMVIEKDKNGCNVPHCEPSCDLIDCPAGEVCILEKVVCVKEPCYPKPTCIACPQIKILCKEGYEIVTEKDKNGCDIPRCVSKCESFKCPEGEKCILKPVTCITTPCPSPLPTCVACPQIAIKCAAGYKAVIEKDENGCEVPHCEPTCDTLDCPDGEKCILEKVVCIKEPCYPQPKCVACPQIAILCLPGYTPVTEKDEDGCDVPRCVSPCESVTCPKGEVCILQDVQCANAPCPPNPTCVACPPVISECPAGQKLMIRKDKNGCDVGHCIHTCDLVDCPSGQSCIMKEVVCVTSPCFPVPTCVDDSCVRPQCKRCPPGQRVKRERGKDGCVSCRCVPSCRGFKCPPGERCSMERVLCKKLPCDPQPRCVARNICRLPKVVGPCEALISRWYYSMGSCKEFKYGGCGGNANNFETLEECQEACPARRPVKRRRRVCSLPKVVVPCDVWARGWYYNKGRCEPFKYGNCGGNKNNFKSLMDCQKLCLGRRVCRLPKLPGPCRGSMNRWYYDTDAKECRVFTYGGCHGNGNNFMSEKECKRACGFNRPAKCIGGMVWKDCPTQCPPSCENPTPVCIKSCGPAQCQCPADKPIWSKEQRQCITVDMCPPKCPAPMIWSDCGSACPLTCDILDEPIACPAVCKVGCVCPKELPVLLGKKCIAAKDCPAKPPGPE